MCVNKQISIYIYIYILTMIMIDALGEELYELKRGHQAKAGRPPNLRLVYIYIYMYT